MSESRRRRLTAERTIGARKAVIFATGGFTHDRELHANFLFGAGLRRIRANSNEGDFVRIASQVGARLRNMQYAWMCPVPLEKAVRSDPDLVGMFSIAGDSMIFVNKHHQHVCNEKLPYNELAQVFFSWDGEKATPTSCSSRYGTSAARDRTRRATSTEG